MTRDIYVFLGPTLSITEARAILDATYLPPVQLGDVSRLIEKKPAVIAIIDGLFDQTPAVWHKEILFAMHNGIRVFGASSMGALRGAELHAFGMEGVGRIFEDFRDGVLEDDDEVAVAHQRADGAFRIESDAMVNIRATLANAVARNVVSASFASELRDLAKRMFYPDRRWRGILADAKRAQLDATQLDALERFLAAGGAVDQKRADAVTLLEHLAGLQAGVIAPHQPSFAFEPTVFWTDMVRSELLSADLRAVAGPLPSGLGAEQLHRHVKLLQARHPDLARQAMMLSLARREAERSPKKLEAQACHERALQLLEDAPTLGAENARRLAEAELSIELVVEEHRQEALGYFALTLAARGLWSDVVEEARAKTVALARSGLSEPSLREHGIEEGELVAWFDRRHGLDESDASSRAWGLGFASAEEFLSETLRQHVFEQGQERASAED